MLFFGICGFLKDAGCVQFMHSYGRNLLEKYDVSEHVRTENTWRVTGYSGRLRVPGRGARCSAGANGKTLHLGAERISASGGSGLGAGGALE